MKMFLVCCALITNTAIAQQGWLPANERFGTVPKGVEVFMNSDTLDGKPFIAWYAIADLKDKALCFTVDTSTGRRLTPQQFYVKNKQPLLIVNCTFFSFQTNQSLNVVVKDGKPVAFNVNSIAQKGKDTLTFKHPLSSAIGISKKRKADVAWTFTDSMLSKVFAVQQVQRPVKDSVAYLQLPAAKNYYNSSAPLKRWKVRTAVGGGPVLVQDGKIAISNNEEMKFAGKAIYDKHPRTLMGYTANNQLIVMVIQGRNPGVADGASLEQCAKLMADIGCIEALNLDGGGSSCMLINGKETIHPSDKGEQRPVPAVFIIELNNEN